MQVLSRTSHYLYLNRAISQSLQDCSHLIFVQDSQFVYLLGLDKQIGSASPIVRTMTMKVSSMFCASLRDVLPPPVAEWVTRLTDVSASETMRICAQRAAGWSDEEMKHVKRIFIAEKP